MNKTQKEPKKGMNPVAAGLIGTVAGAVGAAATMALTDKKARQKVGETFNDLKDQVVGRVKELNDKYMGLRSESKRSMKSSMKK